ncbi:hypothetical protein SUGI_0007710 [Cryptomeria japonica]|nr:hypothetical protein SUGI_0007710 [Cryptomeria japonica]
MAAEKQRALRVVMFPWLAYGHMTPFLELAKRLTAHGLKIFFVSTPLNIQRIKPQMWDAPGIDLVGLAMPSVEGLPAGVESTADCIGKEGGGAASVVLVSFGSECTLTVDEIAAMAMGLQESGASFLWILPAGNSLPQGFQDQIGEKGLLVTKWVPQLHILNHPSTGAFLTHCGWNSITEGLRFGVPFIALPMQFEQGLNARRAQELNVGVEVRRNEDNGSFKKDDINKAIKDIMVEGGGVKIKYNVKKISNMLTDHNLQVSQRNIGNFVSMLRKFNK